MTGIELNAIYGAMISPDARVDVPDEWMPAVHDAMNAFFDLPSEVRAFMIVVGIVRDAEGDVTFEIAAAADFLSSTGLALIRAITDRAHDAVKILGVRH